MLDINTPYFFEDLPEANPRTGPGAKCGESFDGTEFTCDKAGVCAPGERHRTILRDGTAKSMIFWDVE